jgi:hypothetical protein
MANDMDEQIEKQQEFFALAEGFRAATDPEEENRLGEELGE